MEVPVCEAPANPHRTNSASAVFSSTRNGSMNNTSHLSIPERTNGDRGRRHAVRSRVSSRAAGARPRGRRTVEGSPAETRGCLPRAFSVSAPQRFGVRRLATAFRNLPQRARIAFQCRARRPGTRQRTIKSSGRYYADAIRMRKVRKAAASRRTPKRCGAERKKAGRARFLGMSTERQTPLRMGARSRETHPVSSA